MSNEETSSVDIDVAEARLGTVTRLDDGRTCVRFERLLAHPAETVWAAITQPAQLASWFPGFQLELVEGGSFDIWFGGECEGPAHVSGTVVRCEPPRLLECGTMRWELSPRGAQCLLTFSDIVNFPAQRNRTEITNSVLGGWHHYLDMLDAVLAGVEVNQDQPELDYSRFDIPGRE